MHILRFRRESAPFPASSIRLPLLRFMAIWFFPLAVWFAGTPTAHGAVVLYSNQAWQAEIQMEFSPEVVASKPNLEEKLEGLFSAHLHPRGVHYRLQRLAAPGKGPGYTLFLEGGNGLRQLQEILYTVAAPTLIPVEGPVSLELSGKIASGEVLPLALETQSAAGYVWEISGLDAGKVRSRGESYGPKTDLLGAPMTQTLHLEGLADGDTTIRLTYRRPWQPEETPKRKTVIQVPALALVSDLGNPIPPRKRSPVEPAASLADTLADPSPASAVSFDWRNVNGENFLPPVRNQGSCGSCWAFGTVGPLEAAVKIKQGWSVDYSEQYLVSCNSEGWDCGGGWWAHGYHLNKKVPGELESGSVMETSFPYAGQNLACNPPHDHPNKISSWAYVGSSFGVPSKSAIKNAIAAYGPVAAAVCVGPAFTAYRGGIFSTDEKSSVCRGGVNHAVLLVGWDEATDTWILRNSWGTLWGEGGYMRIKRDVSNVGYAANTVSYEPSEPPSPVAPPPVNTLTYRIFLPGTANNSPQGGPCTEVPCNGDFEKGPDGTWTEGSVTGLPIILNLTDFYKDYGLYNHGGSYSAWLGGVESEVNTISQQVTIPANAVLRFYHWIDSADSPNFDTGYIYFDNAELKQYPLDGDHITQGWVLEEIDLTPYAGRTGNIVFKVTTDSAPEFISNFFLDDVAISTSTSRQRLFSSEAVTAKTPAAPPTGARKTKLFRR